MQAMVVDAAGRMPLPVPAARREGIDSEHSVHHSYEKEEITFFTSKDFADMLREEMKQIRAGRPAAAVENESFWRTLFARIPQPQKPGPDNVTPLYSSGAYLTEDVIVCFFDQENGEDKLKVVLGWTDEKGNDKGWVIPGKRDRAYEFHKPENPNAPRKLEDYKHEDVSIQDANESLLQKELGVSRADIAYHFVLSVLDDRKRDDERIKPVGFISLIVLDKPPRLQPFKHIAVPIKGVEQLAERRIKLPPTLNGPQSYGMARGHDSFVLHNFATPKFIHTLAKIRIAQGEWRAQLRLDPRAVRPPLPQVEPGRDCPICFDYLVEAATICKKGHSICGICLPRFFQKECPTCHTPETLLPAPIPNLSLNELIQSLNPEEYRRRFAELNPGRAPKSWRDESCFDGKFVIYPA